MKKMHERILDFITEEHRKTGLMPTVREIGEAMNLKSTCTIVYHLNKLEEQGKIERSSKKSRHITIVGAKEQTRKMPELDFSTFDTDDFVAIPLVGTVAAGQPILAEENIEDVYKMPANLFSGGSLFMLDVKGDSMINAGIFNGDRIIVRRQETANNGDIVVALVEDDEATVKTFFKRTGKIELRPENDHMEPMFFEDILILGKVIGLLRNY
ncbi:MAG: transcriptional repressor LexA [Firmicutes bacterium]|nr:transcriptional repressor LexA [Bacillota bacterium]